VSERIVSPELADQLTPLLARELDLYLEQRALYRELVAVNGHRGVKPPEKPRHRLERRPKSAPPQTAARAPLLVRSFEVAAVEVDGRTLEVLIVPWDRPARVADAPDFKPYTEAWVRGAFSEQLGKRGKVFVNVEHEAGIRGVVGHGIELRDDSEGLVGTFKIHETTDGDKTLELVRAGVLDGVSLEAYATRSVRENGVVKRVKAKLKAVALCRSPAFADARVLAVRDER